MHIGVKTWYLCINPQNGEFSKSCGGRSNLKILKTEYFRKPKSSRILHLQTRNFKSSRKNSEESLQIWFPFEKEKRKLKKNYFDQVIQVSLAKLRTGLYGFQLRIHRKVMGLFGFWVFLGLFRTVGYTECSRIGVDRFRIIL